MEWLTLSEEMEFSYRTSILQKKRPGIVFEAVFELLRGRSKPLSLPKCKKIRIIGKETQPWNFPCAGSIFRNPTSQLCGTN